MRGLEIYSNVDKLRTAEHCFVKWWRKENDFLDYDLIDRFVDNAQTSEEIDGFDLLTMDQMWNEVKRISGGRVNLRKEGNSEIVEWVHTGKTGKHTEVCVFTPETVMHIFDVETKGNPVCPGSI